MLVQEDMAAYFKDILVKAISHLKNIEAQIDKRLEALKIAKKSVDQIDKIVKKEFSEIINSGFSDVTLHLSKMLDELSPKLQKLGVAQTMIHDIVTQLRTDIKLFTMKDLKLKIKELEEIDFTQPIITETVQVTAPSAQKAPKAKATVKSGGPSITKSAVQETPVEEPPTEEDWRESELEGANVFDSLITGWKRRDWEKIGGNKEMFMVGWSKLSSYDRTRIKSGTWSKSMMNKVKLLGREKK